MMKQQDTVDAVNMTRMLDTADVTGTNNVRGTPTTSDTACSSSTFTDEPERPQYDDAILTQLARQLEYYFSQANLDRDTYVETLRTLNDSYVPVSILQRFQKVQAFTPIETEDAIVKAATEFSSMLEVVHIDTKTGKRVQARSGNTLLAVGTITGEPLDNSGLGSVVSTSPKSPVQNTIIIREVDPRITEEDVRALFDEDGPPIQSLYLDVFNCWFVTMDTESRDDMLYVMMQLRAQYLGDEPVKARMKSVVRQVDPTHAPGVPVLSPVSSYIQMSSSLSNGNKKRKQKKRTKNCANNNSGNKGNTNQGGKKSMEKNKGNKESWSTKKVDTQQPKPDLSAASFPALTDDIKKVEVVVDGIEATPNAVASDTSSTVTTLSSSSSAGKQLGGYAAALLKAKPAEKDEGSVQSSSNHSSNDSQSQTWKADTETTSKKSTPPSKAAQVVVKPPVWGGGRSFADVLAL